jgi:hypothetical protein
MSPTSRRHSVATMARARELRAAGWPWRRIQSILRAELGVEVTRDTLLRWCSEGYAAKKAARVAARNLQVRSESWNFLISGGNTSDEYRLAFMRRLADEGVSCAAIAKVCTVVLGQELTLHQVRYALNGRDEYQRAKAAA